MQGEDECWPWLAKRNRYGYGEFNLDGVRRSVQAYVVAYELTHGMILPLADLCVLHRCDNPPCCNPGHLWVGTQMDNMHDKVQKRRQARGERHGSAKLRDEDAIAIRERYAGGEAAMQLAGEYRVSVRQVYRVVRGERFAHLPMVAGRD